MQLTSGKAAAALLAIVALSTLLRVGMAVADPNFDAERPEGMLKSDPGLLYYITERIVESGGLPPDDFRADPLVEHPDLLDLPATFTVGQEFLVAWGHALAQRLGRDAPLHISALGLMALSASLAALGAYGLGRELSGSRGWGLFAAALWAERSGVRFGALLAITNRVGPTAHREWLEQRVRAEAGAAVRRPMMTH